MTRWFYGFPCVSCNCVASFIAECGDTVYGTVTISSPYFDTVVREFSVERTDLRKIGQSFDICRSFVGGWRHAGTGFDIENVAAGAPVITGTFEMGCANSGLNEFNEGVWRTTANIGRSGIQNQLQIPRTDCAGTIRMHLSTADQGCSTPRIIELSTANECPELPITVTFDATCFASASDPLPGQPPFPPFDASLVDATLDLSFAP